MQNIDIRLLLDQASSDIADMGAQAELGTIKTVLLKNTLENMRSALDYLAQDIAAKLIRCSPDEKLPRRIYFPYARDRYEFEKSLARNLPTLGRDLPEVLTIITRYQPFSCSSNWLIDLVELTNETKHNFLHKPENITSQNVVLPGWLSASARTVIITGSRVNGKSLDDVVVENGEITVIKPGEVSFEVTVDNHLLFLGKDIEILPFLRSALLEVESLVMNVSQQL